MQNKSRDLEAQHGDGEDQKREARCNMCCAWSSLVIGSLLVILLLLGVLFFSFFEGNMPGFSLSRLAVNNLQFDTKGRDILMDSDLEIALNATNKDGDIEFYYTHMRVDIYSGDVFLGGMHLPELLQETRNSTVLTVHVKLNKQPIAEADSLKLKSDLQDHRLAVDVNLNGYIHYIIKGRKFTGFPFKVICQNMSQYVIDQTQVACRVKMTPLS